MAGGGSALSRGLAGVALGWLLAGAPGPALAAVPALLGPGGVTHVGPLPPGDPRPLGTVVVDPFDGGLHVVIEGVAGRFVWTREAGWTVDGTPVTAADTREVAGPDGLPRLVDRRRWDWRNDRVVAILLPDGGRVGVDTDERSRLRELSWPGGRELQVGWDGFDRVVATEGPGASRASYGWRDGQLELSDDDGRPTRIQRRTAADGTVQVTVSDGAGRQVESRWTADGETLLGWTDPRGQSAVLERSDDRLSLSMPGGAGFWLQTDDAGRLLALRDPLGGTWRWRRDGAGRVEALEEPGGRVWRWDRDDVGRLVALGWGGAPWRLRRADDGQVRAVVDPGGSPVTLERDAAGRIVAITDAAGAVLRLRRHSSGAVAAITSRTGAAWELPADISGGRARVQDPRGRSFELRRDLSGRLVALYDADVGEWKLERDPSGRVTAMQAPEGERWVLRRGPGGALSALVVPGVGELSLQRDPAGDVTALRWQEEDRDTQVAVRRDVLGRPVAVEVEEAAVPPEEAVVRALRWTRDANGRVRAIRAPGRSLRLARGPAGLLRSVEAGDAASPWRLRLDRDAAGRVVHWLGTDGEITVQRDAVGRPIREEVELRTEVEPALEAGGGEGDEAADSGAGDLGAGDLGAGEPPSDGGGSLLDPLGHLLDAARALAVEALDGVVRVEVAWDPRGSVQQLRHGDGSWRVLRDAAGRLLRLVGPGGRAVGVDRDGAGQILLVRHPAGSLQRRGVEGQELLVEVVGVDGRRLDGEVRRYDPRGRIAAEETLGGGLRLWTRDALGRPVDDGGAGLGGTPSGGASARGGEGPLAWGVGLEALRRDRDEAGMLRWVAGEAGIAGLRWDPLGRLEAVDLDVGSRWELRRDARGRLAAVLRDGLVVDRLTWGPGLAAGAPADRPATLLRSGPLGTRTWWSWGGGMAGLLRDGVLHDVITDPDGSPWWVAAAPAGPTEDPRLSATARTGGGAGGQDAAALVGVGGAIQPFPGGPLLPASPLEGGAVPGARVLDPLTREPVDGLAPWPWATAGWEPSAPDGGPLEPSIIDPAPWDSESPWAEPLELLVALGQLQAPPGAEGLVVVPPTAVLAGLPGSLEAADPPVGPDRGSLPLDQILGPAEVDQAVVSAALQSALPGGAPLTPAGVLEAVLAEDAALPWLPPGLTTPWEGFSAP